MYDHIRATLRKLLLVSEDIIHLAVAIMLLLATVRCCKLNILPKSHLKMGNL
jgi:hypothetical protein